MDPNGTQVDQWSRSPGSSFNHQAVDDGIRRQTVPTLTDYVTGDDTAGVINDEYTLTDPGQGSTTLHVWVYASTSAAGQIDVDLNISGSWLGAVTAVGNGASTGWYRGTFIGSWSSGQLNDAKMRLTKNSSGASSGATVYATYVEVE